MISGNGVANDLFVAAVEAIYACAAAPSNWPHALQAVADVFSDVGTVLLWRGDDGSIGTIVSPKLAAAVADFHKGWWRQDIRSFRALEQGYLRRQEVFTDRHIATQEEIDGHPIYTQFLVPHGLGWFAGARSEISQGEIEWLNKRAYETKFKVGKSFRLKRIATQRITGVDERRRIVACVVDKNTFLLTQRTL